MPAPIGLVCGRLYETADAVHLPRAWPTLGEVAMYVDANTPGLNVVFGLASRSGLVRRALESTVELGARAARWVGSSRGGMGYEIEAADGRIARLALVSSEYGHRTAVAPAVLAARRIVEDRQDGVGLCRVDRLVEPEELFEYLARSGMRVVSDLGLRREGDPPLAPP
jgi:hypothetical protein